VVLGDFVHLQSYSICAGSHDRHVCGFARSIGLQVILQKRTLKNAGNVAAKKPMDSNAHVPKILATM
jgi:hypothetical protein